MNGNEAYKPLNFEKLLFGNVRSYDSAIREIPPIDLPQHVKDGTSQLIVSLPDASDKETKDV